jgi:hypothetical protein
MRRTVGKMLAARTLQGRSPLYRWLHAHHAEITAHMATQARPAWEALAQTARDTGQLDSNGNPPNRHSIRKAWQTLERDLNRQPTIRKPDAPTTLPPVSSPVSSPVASPAIAVQPVQATGPATQASAPARPRPVFAVARFKPTPNTEG